jgi:hypothetical protein
VPPRPLRCLAVTAARPRDAPERTGVRARPLRSDRPRRTPRMRGPITLCSPANVPARAQLGEGVPPRPLRCLAVSAARPRDAPERTGVRARPLRSDRPRRTPRMRGPITLCSPANVPARVQPGEGVPPRPSRCLAVTAARPRDAPERTGVRARPLRSDRLRRTPRMRSPSRSVPRQSSLPAFSPERARLRALCVAPRPQPCPSLRRPSRDARDEVRSPDRSRRGLRQDGSWNWRACRRE